jgi:hypothetical protein
MIAGFSVVHFGASACGGVFFGCHSAPAQCGVIPPLFLQLACGFLRTRSIMTITYQLIISCNTGSNFA